MAVSRIAARRAPPSFESAPISSQPATRPTSGSRMPLQEFTNLNQFVNYAHFPLIAELRRDLLGDSPLDGATSNR
jgi:hypothetical protein